MRTFPPEDEADVHAFLAATPRALVLFRGTHCPYSATFRPHFEQAAVASASSWTFAVRDLDESDEAAWDAHGIEVTPTVVAFVDGRPASRIGGTLFMGITRPAFAKWLKSLAGPGPGKPDTREL